MRSRSVLLLACLAVACALLALPAAAHLEPHPLSNVMVERIQHKLGNGVITVDTPKLQGKGATVTVTWTGMSSTFPGNFDWIGVYSPKPESYQKTSPGKFKFVTPDGTGSGSTKIWLLNMRASFTLAYFTGGLKDPVLLAESEPIEFDNYIMPTQIHLALTSNPTEMRVDWTSGLKTSPGVWWGPTSNFLIYQATRVSTDKLERHEMCGAPATTTGFRDSGYLHTVVLEGLEPGKQYWYRVGGVSPSDQSSEVFSFFAAPAHAPRYPSEVEQDFFIFGDLGSAETDGSMDASREMFPASLMTTSSMAKDLAEGIVALSRSAAVFHIGDISYARGFQTIWEQFFYQLSPMSPFLPWMTIDGNHERDFPDSGSKFTGQDSGGECGVATRKRFHMPIPDERKPDQIWWSVNYGLVHMTVISTEHEFNSTSEQYKWIAQDWAKVDRSVTPFLILAGHRPMYIDSTNNNPAGGDTTVGDMLIDALEPLMQKYQVDAAFWGHHHSYQRTCAVRNHKCVADGTVHIVTGAAGPDFSRNIQPATPAWIEHVDISHHGYVRAQLRGGEVRFEFVNAENRDVLDSVTIKSRFPIKKLNVAQEAEPVALL